MKKQTKFLRLTQDLVFKIFFSRDKQLLFSLLKNFLPISEAISDVEILNLEGEDKENVSTKAANKLDIENSAILPESIDKKQIVLDLNVKLASGANLHNSAAIQHKVTPSAQLALGDSIASISGSI